MGTESIWVPLALSALGAGANHYNSRQVAKRQDNILADQIRQQGVRQQEADRAVSEAMRQRAAQGAEVERGQVGDQYLQQVRAAQGAAMQGLGQAGAVSSAYQQAANDAAMGIGDYAGQTASLMSRIDAPTMQRQREGQQDTRLAFNLEDLGRRSRGDDYLAQLRLQNVKRNPWIDMASSLMGAAAGYTAGAGGGQSLAGIQAGAKSAADFSLANRSLMNANTNKILTGWGG